MFYIAFAQAIYILKFQEDLLIFYVYAIARLVLLEDHFFTFSLSSDFHELWRSVMSICLFTEVIFFLICLLIFLSIITMTIYIRRNREQTIQWSH